MLSITSSQSVVWPSASVASVAPVSAATAVKPVQSSARDTQAGLGQGRDSPVPGAPRRGSAPPAEAAQKEGRTPDAAPLLPRESPDSADGQVAAELSDAQALAEREKAAEQEQDKALKQQLQDVLSNVWKASAAVVEVALARETTASETPSDSVGTLGSVAAAPPGAPEQVAAPRLAPAALLGARNDAANDGLPSAVPEPRAVQDVVAYDAQGNSSWAPLEAGSLISRRV